MRTWLILSAAFLAGWTFRGAFRPPKPAGMSERSRQYIEQYVDNCKSPEVRAIYPDLSVPLWREDGATVSVPCDEFLRANDRPNAAWIQARH